MNKIYIPVPIMVAPPIPHTKKLQYMRLVRMETTTRAVVLAGRKAVETDRTLMA